MFQQRDNNQVTNIVSNLVKTIRYEFIVLREPKMAIKICKTQIWVRIWNTMKTRIWIRIKTSRIRHVLSTVYICVADPDQVLCYKIYYLFLPVFY